MAKVQGAHALHEIEADVNFLVDTGIKPVNIPSTPGGGKSEHIGCLLYTSDAADE